MSRCGIGYDSHRFAEGRALILGGWEIPGEKGLEGHSDADVLCHALVDAILGAAALGDIGQHFPDTDPRWKDASSLDFLKQTIALLQWKQLRLLHLDASIITESPRLSPHLDAIRASLAAAAGLEVTAVSVKATSNEGMGWIGRGEGMAALAIASVEETS
ncbi:MAG: 2-C-methyl-D-erythritol 2,4-cyclodiphosphate synthase [Candidatus Krumholzibacteria bacterium]|jgi:2-C-methyl-D-erythritol 2,4-cyclodiphosphate synthase|nr:2-C-methyl-D-erythritol 2,4-cyclodiphosphate synthase [Candidatus Krumholzibacteria bacterium]MDP6669521.1 2-C-methyl-D-erythritol 2,4-cyclodiphosphate synthase [Candidatus Krumholzibacteria bacterium]MDP6797843.1 2-C-methyl-D-erythritol 2,4-cyclodiphosphate synthase [Candidatus Krumholzibacteria bacterium]MDP7022521.1 2-C-methyl-D-erythritol 2,4-cyclodiphosphate synthase [Candidatus Krumholzibacteria bacterium]